MKMDIRGTSEHAEDFHFPLKQQVVVSGEVACPALGLLWDLAWPLWSTQGLAPVLSPMPQPTLGKRLLTGLWA